MKPDVIDIFRKSATKSHPSRLNYYAELRNIVYERKRSDILMDL